MKIYFSWYISKSSILKEDRGIIKNVLVAFPEMKNKKDIPVKKWTSVFLDSWGFSIRNKWLNLSIDDYIEYLKKFGDKYEIITNMDTSDTEETLANQKRLEDETWYKILPVYHWSELKEGNKELMEYYCKNYDFVALWWVAGIGMSKSEKRYYLDFCFKIAIKYKTKLHWFGITSYWELLRYPFYSVDSTSWLQWVKFNTFTTFKNWKIIKFTADEYRKKYWIDYSKLSYKDRLLLNYNAYQNMADYITKLHKVKWMEYWK